MFHVQNPLFHSFILCSLVSKLAFYSCDKIKGITNGEIHKFKAEILADRSSLDDGLARIYADVHDEIVLPSVPKELGLPLYMLFSRFSEFSYDRPPGSAQSFFASVHIQAVDGSTAEGLAEGKTNLTRIERI